MNEKLLQIIPAPADMWATFKDGDGETKRERVACLALVEDKDKHRRIAVIVRFDPVDFYIVSDSDPIVGIEYGEA